MRRRVTVLGAGMVAKPLVDYFLDRYGYDLILADADLSRA